MVAEGLERFGIFKEDEATSELKHSIDPTEEEGVSEDEDAPILEREASQNLLESYLVSATYDGERKAACLKLYEPRSNRIYLWYDNTGHLPYCLSKLPAEELRKIKGLVDHPGLDHFESVKKYDPLEDESIETTKIVAKDPLSIGGRRYGCIRDIIPKAWEADIRYYQSYIYDRDLRMGMPYRIENGDLKPVDPGVHPETLEELRGLLEKEPEDFRQYIETLVSLFECPVPKFRRVALDIEVATDVPTRVPDPHDAAYPVVCVTLLGSDGAKRVLLLRRPGIREGEAKMPSDVRIEYYDGEDELLTEVFKALRDYPVVLSFNGDNFDLRYLVHRAERQFRFTRDQIPIELGREFALLKYGIHIDLYKLFFNRSLQVYAFSQKYRENTLDAVGRALLGMAKLELTRPLPELTYTELANYCYRDAEITMKLTTFDDDLVMKLLTVLTRISRMPMEDVNRQGVSRWIRSLMYYEHRRRNFLIPRLDDLLELKGTTATKAVIKGKKYKGAIVVEPIPGPHFDVAVLDFASLYPSIMRNYNLSYETVLCPHSECHDNRIPETPHWVCRKRRGLSSLVIGSLRDLRVKWYKRRAKDEALPKSLRNLYNVVQLTLKVFINAAYGVMGAKTFALYCPPVAEATAAIGRYAITETIEKARSLDIKVVYGDTDSVFLESPAQRQIDELVEWSDKSLGMELEVDKLYRYAAFSLRKKNYLGVYPDGSVDIKGLTGKKRHMPEFLKRTFLEMIRTLSEVKSSEDFEKAKEEIREIVHACHVRLKNRQYPIGDLAFSVMLSKPPSSYVKTTPQHVKAAKLLVKAGYEIKAGDVISFVKVTNKPEVKPVQLATIGEVDVDKYMEYVKSTFEQVLDAVGLDFDEIMGVTRLESFL